MQSNGYKTPPYCPGGIVRPSGVSGEARFGGNISVANLHREAERRGTTLVHLAERHPRRRILQAERSPNRDISDTNG